jgi:hypothetical protein
MSDFTYNENTGYLEAMYEAHTVYVADDTYMIQLQLLQDGGLTEAEALDEVSSVAWWLDHTPMSGLFIDGQEQTDEAELIKATRRDLPIETTTYNFEEKSL